MSNKDTHTIKDISDATYELVKKAAQQEKLTIHDWVEATLKNAAELTLQPGAVVNDPEKLGALIMNIEKRLTNIENGPLQNGARMVSEGAKAIGESAKEIYEKVEARKWFDKSYETATSACETLSQHFKTWWESRGGNTTTTTTDEPAAANKTETETIVEAEVIEVETQDKKAK